MLMVGLGPRVGPGVGAGEAGGVGDAVEAGGAVLTAWAEQPHIAKTTTSRNAPRPAIICNPHWHPQRSEEAGPLKATHHENTQRQ